ncbi:hypothetical protein IAR55_004836 [Kwoniella newhampshirensis]|uniref:CBM21 domain-containing protein n=1 Tax=Kwoniella newhampshirensis TaxID=1651941 RepID=A0AAW0YWQ2_9TREE
MPYTEPITPSPLQSPSKEQQHHGWRKGHSTPPTHIEDVYSGPSHATGPMPGIPRRSSSNPSASSTPRRTMSPNMSRHVSATHQLFPISRPMEGLPRRSPSSSGGAPGVSGLPPAESSSTLGLKFNGSPSSKRFVHHQGEKEAMSSTSSVVIALPATPDGRSSHDVDVSGPMKNGEHSVPFPTFDPHFKPPPRATPTTNPLSPHTRPTLFSARRGSAGHLRGGQGTTGSLQIPIPTSASTSALNQDIIGGSVPSPNLLRPTASMIRKKSGEVVKPSLKQRSMSTPDLTRQADYNSPTEEGQDSRPFGEERSKSVRFADTSEGDAKALESVVLFLREQKVTAVGKAADPDNALPSETETENDTDASDFVQFRTRKNAAARAADEAGQLQMDVGSRIPRKRTDFSPDARGSLEGENIVLERVELQNGSGQLTLRGSAIVRNLAFRKWVAVRFTLDHWQTVSEVSGTHVCHIPAATSGDEGWDRFSFAIKLEDYKRKLEERQLLLCLHYSVEGSDWWDSNDGMNYSFTFRRSAPRRVNRVSGPASLGGHFLRLNEPSISNPLPGLRNTSVPPPSSQIRAAFGVSETAKVGGPKDWIFPKLAQRVADQPISRPDSPAQTPPPNRFKPPAPPSAHTHLSLAKYCAPSPPQSPPKDGTFEIPLLATSLDSKHESVLENTRRTSMNLVGGNYATLSPSQDMGHERRSSWNGQPSNWDSFAQAMVKSEEGGDVFDGDSTPVARGSRSPEFTPEISDASTSSPAHRPLTLKRSTGDLRKLVQEAEDNENGLMTPPSSNLSSPPTPIHSGLPAVPMSPSPSASTGESSPVETISADSPLDLSSLEINVEPEARGRTGHPNDHKSFTSGSYQEFLDKFCFFQSPRMTPNEIDPVYSRSSYVPASGQSSPGGFPFFTTSGSNSTPTKQYASTHDAFSATGHSNTSASTTPKPASQQPVTSTAPHHGAQYTVGFHANPSDARAWAQQIHSNAASPSLTAAK